MYDFLSEAISSKRKVTIYILNGFQMSGVIVGVYGLRKTILFDTDDGPKLIFMSAISTIS